jgi:hypothetical protein
MDTHIEPIEVFIAAEDQFIRLQMNNATQAELTVRDLHTGEQQKHKVSNIQAAAIIALLIGGDELPFKDALYQQAEPIFERMPINLRCIP